LRGDGTWNAPAGGVTSAVAGNGVAVSAATGAVTFSLGGPSYNTIGSYVFGYITGSPTSGATYSAGTLVATSLYTACGGVYMFTTTNNLSGTWRYMGATVSGLSNFLGIFVRVS
jgi:hypothetical protein